MKKLFIAFLVSMLSFSMFAQSIYPFGEEVAKEGDWTIYLDEFKGTSYAVQKVIGNTFNTGFEHFNIYPYFMFDTNKKTVSIHIHIDNTISSNPNVNVFPSIDEIIFLSGSQKVTLKLADIKQDKNEYRQSIDFTINLDTFEKLIPILCDKTLRCAYYYVNGGARELNVCGERQKQVIQKAYNFCTDHFQDYTFVSFNNDVVEITGN